MRLAAKHPDVGAAASPAEHALTRPKNEKSGFWATMEKTTGLTGAALGVYWVIFEGSRVVFPLRNFAPIP